MKNLPILYGIVGLVVGVLIASFFAPNVVNKSNQEKVEENIHQQHMMVGDSMSGMVGSLSGKTGDEYDKEFIEQMIVHHQGAIDMSRLSTASAKHQEIKDLSEDIINAQTSEIEMMRQWQKTWGY